MSKIKLTLFAACRDGKDGSHSVTLLNTKEEALKDLGKTEDELEEGTYYDDGVIEEVEVVLVEKDGKWKLEKEIYFSIE